MVFFYFAELFTAVCGMENPRGRPRLQVERRQGRRDQPAQRSAVDVRDIDHRSCRPADFHD